ncbi:MAG: ExeM/NucH family extracellular endonuclease, partial [Pseudomonadota bacterium]
DSNGDGVANFGEDEFVEIVNTTGQPLDVSGWLLADGFDTRHVFPAGSVIADGCALVVFGGGEPTGAFGGALVQTASSGSLGLNNGGDTVTLNTGATDAARVEYGGEGGANQSLTRSPDISGDFAQHLSVSAARFSPGTAADGSTFAGCDAPVQVVTIAQVQGSGASSPFAGQNVVVEGVVTGDLQDSDADEQNSIRGFYVQSAVADSDPETSEGIYVFDGPSPAVDVAVGDIVRVSGAATEFFGETQISASSVEIIGSGGSIAPVTVTLPVANVVLGDDGEYIADLERYEGMLVTITTPLTVTDVFNLDRFGELLLVAGERPLQFTNTNAPDAAGLDAYLQALGARSIMLDDGLTVQNPDPIRYPAPGLPNATDDSVRTGDGVLGVTGNVRFSRGSGGSGDALYRIMPTVEPVFVNNNPRQQTPPPVGGSLRVVSANVLNYFTTIDLPGATCGPSLIGCRGADSDIEFERQQQKLVTQLLALDADVIGLIEVENNPQESLASLVDAMNAALGETQYAFLDTGTIGGDAIKVGFVYRAAKVAPTGPFAVLDSSVDPRFIDNRNRPVLAQTFREIATAGTLTIAVNHLKSKGSSCDDTGDFDLGDGQGNCNLTRTLAAQATVDWLATDPTGSGDADILVIGDFNAYLLEDPINAYRDAGYTNLLDDLAPEDAYTLNFDRQSGALDHAIATASMLPQIAGVSIWHINTDEADAIDYNLNFGRNPDIFNGTLAQRGSDHDPVLVGLSLVGDLDGDGVNNADDVCPATAIPEAAPTSGQLRKYRWALVDADNIFDTPKDSGLSFTTQDTAGCSCTQIVERLSLAAGQLRQGCTTRVLQKWIGQLD